MTIRYIYYIRIVITWSTTIVVCSIHSISVEWLHFVQLQGILNFNYFQLDCNGYQLLTNGRGIEFLYPVLGCYVKDFINSLLSNNDSEKLIHALLTNDNSEKLIHALLNYSGNKEREGEGENLP